MLVNDRSAERFVEAHSDLSTLEIALTPDICKIFKYRSSCLHRAGVTGHPADGSAEAFAQSAAPFEHGRPEGLEGMGDSFVEDMRWRLHIRILLSRMGCFTAPHQDQLSSDSCIVLLALHAGKGSVGQWRIKLLDPGYLGKAADTASADGDRAASEFSSYTYPLPSGGAAAIATCTSLENACCLHGFEGADMVQGKGEYRIMVQLGCRCPPHQQDLFLEHVRGFGRCRPSGTSSSW
jgi:hypothetical protein